MFKGTVLCSQRSKSLRHCAKYLSDLGIQTVEQPGPDVTHLLLPVPSFPDGDGYLAHLLSRIPDNVVVSGGNLFSPLLDGYRAVDFLQDPYYLAENAALTARCAVEILENEPNTALSESQVLILGWGRIGKCLGSLLKDRCAGVTIAARRSADLAMIRALGCRSIHTAEVSEQTGRFDMIVNTVPELLLTQIQTKPDAFLLELASKPGMHGENIRNGRGLPGKTAPERSGILIAQTFIRLSLS